MAEVGNESMEDILHSIRDIIAEEDKKGKKKPSAAAEPEAESDEGEEEDVLDLVDVVGNSKSMMTFDKSAASKDKPEEEEEEEEVLAVQEFEKEPEPTPTPVVKKAAPIPQAPKQKLPDTTLISDSTAHASMDAMRHLVESIPRPRIDSPVHRTGNTVEDLVIEALKPMLSDWLDKNLATIVEEIAQREIRKLLPHE